MDENANDTVGVTLYRNLPGQGYPERMKVKMRYYVGCSLNQDNLDTTPTIVRFRANGLFDPDVRIGGNQPRGFDQFMQLYQNYTVIGSKIDVNITSGATASPNLGVLCGVYLSSDQDVLELVDIMEQPYNNYTLLHRGVGHQPAKITQTFSTDFLGYNNPMSETDLRGTASNDPDVQAYFNVWAQKTLDTTEHVTAAYGHIEYVVILSNHNLPTAS